MMAVQLLLMASMRSIQRGVKLLRLGVTTENPRLRGATKFFGSRSQRRGRIKAQFTTAAQLWGVDLDFLCRHTGRLTRTTSTPLHCLHGGPAPTRCVAVVSATRISSRVHRLVIERRLPITTPPCAD